MTWHIDQIWRYPIKGIGAELLRDVSLKAGLPLPLDRAWAVLEDGGDTTEGWRSCRNFLRGAKGPSLMAVTAQIQADTVVLSHPDLADLQMPLDPVTVQTELFEWLQPIYPTERRAPVAVVKAPQVGMADAPFASISVLTCASLRALSQKAGRDLDPRRFRGNIWLEGTAPWEEFDMIGKTLAIGEAILEIVEPITRCRATEANPKTGRRDTNTLGFLEDGWGHTDFGVYAKVKTGGQIRTRDKVRVI